MSPAASKPARSRGVCAAGAMVLMAAQGGAVLRSSSSARAGEGPVEQGDGRPVMGIGETLRVGMCWGKPDIIAHEKCMEFLINTCKDRSSGHGTCVELQDLVRSECENGGPHKLIACRYAKDMGITIGDEKESAPAAEDDGVQTLEEKKLADNSTESEESAVVDKTVEGGLPDQGFDGHSTEMVEHKDADTQTADWGNEWPQSKQTDGQLKEQICKDYPRSPWCKMYMAHRSNLKGGGSDWGLP